MVEENKIEKTDKEEAEELLNKATVGEGWETPRGRMKYPLIVNDEIIGYLWEKLDLKDVNIDGMEKKTCHGKKYILLHNKKQVGFIMI